MFELSVSGQWTLLWGFNVYDGGGENPSGVISDSAGNFYGTASGGELGYGFVYKLTVGGAGETYTTLYNFTGGTDGGGPWGVIEDSAGHLYGTAGWGAGGAGVIYRLTAAGQQTVLYSFPGPTGGSVPHAGVIRDSAGNLYGTTYDGGPSGAGVVYKHTAAGLERILYSFTGGADGGHPIAGVIRDSSDNLYGTTAYGGTAGCGTVYKVDSTGHETVLYSFSNGADGGFPQAGVILDSSGNLYGTTQSGGAGGAGVVYKVDTGGHETVLYNFTGGADGGYPYAGVIRDSAGDLYGTTYNGGTYDMGVVYTVDTNGQETVLHSFTGGNDGAYPYAGVIRDPSGNLYGTTMFGSDDNGGVVYKLDAAGQETVLYLADGSIPYAGVIRDSLGNLYGTTNYGGSANAGVVYKVDTAGNETVLYSFTGGTDGGYPFAGVILDPSGNLYGTTPGGGTKNAGVIFEITP